MTAAHTYGFNSGTVGVALLGTLTTQTATVAARDAVVEFLAWKADSHGIDPNGSATFVNPVNGSQKTFPNIAGHRDVEATECPGGAFYNTLPDVRNRVAARIKTGTTGMTISTSSTTTATSSTTTTTRRKGPKVR